MNKRLLNRLRSQSGESIAEVLVSLLISAVAVVLLVGMIGASTKVVLRSTRAMHAQYARTAGTRAASESSVSLSWAGRNGINRSQSFGIYDYVYEEAPVFYVPKNALG